MSVGLYAPGLDTITGGVAAEVRLFDPSLVVVFNKRCVQNSIGQWEGRYEIYDRNAPGGPQWQLVIRVQDEDGSFRPLDSRVMDTLRQARGRTVTELLDEMERSAEWRDREIERHISNLAAGMADDMKYLGRQFGPSVTWRDRTDPAARERIRQEASA